MSVDVSVLKLAAAAKYGSDMAKLQIQYNLLLKENGLLREKQEKLAEETRLARVQLDNERKQNRDLKT